MNWAQLSSLNGRVVSTHDDKYTLARNLQLNIVLKIERKCLSRSSEVLITRIIIT
jgi:hypothetical protein